MGACAAVAFPYFFGFIVSRSRQPCQMNGSLALDTKPRPRHVGDAKGADQAIHALKTLAESGLVQQRSTGGPGAQSVGAPFEIVLVSGRGDQRRGGRDQGNGGPD